MKWLKRLFCKHKNTTRGWSLACGDRIWCKDCHFEIATPDWMQKK